MKFLVCLKSLRHAILLLLFISSQLFADVLFPVPESLEKNIQFWVQVYSRYSTSEVLIHDRNHLDIVYQVIDLNDYYPENASLRTKWRKVSEISNQYERILDRLCQVDSTDLASLSDQERYVYNLWLHIDDANKFRTARYNVRGQKGLREKFRNGVIRSGRFKEKITEILREYDVPEDLQYLPHVESSFNHKAYSRVGAAGMWQFMRSTGRVYMNVGYTVDERLDPILSSIAAARLLRDNYLALQSWPLAITAYNHGLNGMKRAKARHGSDIGKIVSEYQSRIFGFASRNFYAEFLAARKIASNYEFYFGPLELDKPLEYKVFELPDYVTLNTLLRRFDLDVESIAELNPALRPAALKSQRRIPRGYPLRLPSHIKNDWETLYASLDPSEKYNDQIRDKYYTIRMGDNLSDIARRAGTTINMLMALNNISNPHRIRAGQIIEIPSDEKVKVTDELAQKRTESPAQESLGGGTLPEPEYEHVNLAKKSDTLEVETSEITHNDAVDFELMGPMAPGNDDAQGTNWTFKVSFSEPQGNRIIVQPEETLGHFADWLRVSTHRLRVLNGLSPYKDIQIGQSLQLVLSQVSPQEFHRQRLEYHRALQSDFFSNFQIDAVKEYTINRGDNIWYLCNRVFQVPWWLLAQYNENKDLKKLYPGDQIQVPIVSAFADESFETSE